MRILFLDIDGVLNHSDYAESVYDELDKNDLVESNVLIYKDNLYQLKRIIDQFEDLRIVWSTDWRLCNDEYYVWDENKLMNPLIWLESLSWLKSRIIGKTPKKMSSTRSEEILAWFSHNDKLKKHKDPNYIEVLQYTILDDCHSSEMAQFKDHLFNTWYDQGLDEIVANKLIKFLQKDVENDRIKKQFI